MKSKLFLTLTFLGVMIYSNSFEDGLKMESIGDKSKAIKIYNDYFDENINSLTNELLKNQVVHVATLYNDTDLSIKFLKRISILIKSRDKRNIIYGYIGNIYELTGNILEAGKYYEKASIRGDKSRDYGLYLYSLELLQELGYIEKVHSILLSIEKLVDISNKENYQKLLHRSNYLLGELERDYVNSSKNIYKYRLETPNDYFFKNNVTDQIGHNKIAPKISYLFLGYFRDTPSGIINILEQLKLDWDYRDNNLTVISENLSEASEKLNKAGINYDIR